MHFRCTDQSIDAYTAWGDPLRRKSESEMEIGAGCPEQFVSLLRMDNAALSCHEESLVAASCHQSLRFEYALADMRSLFG